MNTKTNDIKVFFLNCANHNCHVNFLNLAGSLFPMTPLEIIMIITMALVRIFQQSSSLYSKRSYCLRFLAPHPTRMSCFYLSWSFSSLSGYRSRRRYFLLGSSSEVWDDHNKVATRLEQSSRHAAIVADWERASCWIDCWNNRSSFRRRSRSFCFCSLILRLRSFRRASSTSETSSPTSVIRVWAVDSQTSQTPNSVLLVVVTISYNVISPSVDPRLFLALQLYLPRSSCDTLSILRRIREL